MKPWHHWVFAIVVGYLLGYYFRQVGDMTIGKLMKSAGSMQMFG